MENYDELDEESAISSEITLKIKLQNEERYVVVDDSGTVQEILN
jgi:hypothetical protein